MERLNVETFEKMCQLLHEYNFEMNENVPCEFNCGRCKKLLIDSHAESCGCKFCCSCLNEMLTKGFEKCPGNTDECKEVKLIDFVSDDLTNLKISKLVLKCPKQICFHKCELVEMDEHLRSCLNRSVEYPFFGMGYNEDKLIVKGMGDHLQAESYNHYRIFFEMIGTLKNELKKRDETLKEIAKNSDEAIADMQQQIQRIKTQIEQIFRENAGRKDETIGVMQAAFTLIKKEKQETTTQIRNSEIELANKIVNSTQQMKQERQNNLEREVSQINDKMGKWQLQMTSRIEELEKWQDTQMEASLTWTVTGIADKIQVNTNIYSSPFYSKLHPYKMQLQLYKAKGSDEIRIFLNIYTGETDAGIVWPYQENVIIVISNKAHPDASKAISKYCNITKPVKNSCNSSDPFKFSYKELLTSGLMQDNYFVIQCYEE